MKLSDLFESSTSIPFVVGMLQRLFDRGEPIYFLRFTSGGEEACRILTLDYTPATTNVGGGLRMMIATMVDGEPRKRPVDMVHSIGEKGAAEFDERWTIRTIGGKKVFHMRDRTKMIDNLKDEIFFVEQAG